MPNPFSDPSNILYQAARASKAYRPQGSGYAPQAPTEPPEANEPLEAPADKSILRNAGSTAVSGISSLGHALDLPGSMARDVLTWLPGGAKARNPFDQLMDPFGKQADKNRIEGREFLRESGLAGKRDTWGSFLAGLGFEVATDPLTFFTPNALTRGGNAAVKSGLTGGKRYGEIVDKIAQIKGYNKLNVPSFGRSVGTMNKLRGRDVLEMQEHIQNDLIQKMDKSDLTMQKIEKEGAEPTTKSLKLVTPANAGKRKFFNSFDELKEYAAPGDKGSWAVVDNGLDIEVYKSEFGKEGWDKLDDDATRHFRQKLAEESPLEKTYNQAMREFRTAYQGRYGATDFDDALDQPLHSIVSLRFPGMQQKDLSLTDAPGGGALARWMERHGVKVPETNMADDAAGGADDIAGTADDLPSGGGGGPGAAPGGASPTNPAPTSVTPDMPSQGPSGAPGPTASTKPLKDLSNIPEINEQLNRLDQEISGIWGNEASEAWVPVIRDYASTVKQNPNTVAKLLESLRFKLVDPNSEEGVAVIAALKGGNEEALAQTVYHGAANRFNPEMLVRMEDGTKRFLASGDQMPEGVAEIEGHFPYGRFRTDKIGTGQGAQSFGWGLYFAEKKDIADFYRSEYGAKNRKVLYKGRDLNQEALDGKELTQAEEMADEVIRYMEEYDLVFDDAVSELEYGLDDSSREILENALRSGEISEKAFSYQKGGALYKAKLAPKDDEYLLWDQGLSKQPKKVQEALKKLGYHESRMQSGDITGGQAYKRLQIGEADETTVVDSLEDLAGEFPREITRERMYDIAAEAIERFGITEDASIKIGVDLADEGVSYTVINKARELMKSFAQQKMNPKQLSEKLKELGVRGIKFLDGASRNEGKGSYNFVIFDDADVAIEEVLAQKSAAGFRGAFRKEGTQQVIRAFMGENGADFTTLVHETGHFFRRNLPKKLQDAADKGMESLLKDPKRLEAALPGAKVGKTELYNTVKGEKRWSRAAEEIWAKLFEQYVATGKAPTKGLAQAFSRVKEMMIGVYQFLKGKPGNLNKISGGEIPKEFQAIFDDMLSRRNLNKPPAPKRRAAGSAATPAGKAAAATSKAATPPPSRAPEVTPESRPADEASVVPKGVMEESPDSSAAEIERRMQESGNRPATTPVPKERIEDGISPNSTRWVDQEMGRGSDEITDEMMDEMPSPKAGKTAGEKKPAKTPSLPKSVFDEAREKVAAEQEELARLEKKRQAAKEQKKPETKKPAPKKEAPKKTEKPKTTIEKALDKKPETKKVEPTEIQKVLKAPKPNETVAPKKPMIQKVTEPKKPTEKPKAPEAKVSQETKAPKPAAPKKPLPGGLMARARKVEKPVETEADRLAREASEAAAASAEKVKKEKAEAARKKSLEAFEAAKVEAARKASQSADKEIAEIESRVLGPLKAGAGSRDETAEEFASRVLADTFAGEDVDVLAKHKELMEKSSSYRKVMEDHEKAVASKEKVLGKTAEEADRMAKDAAKRQGVESEVRKVVKSMKDIDESEAASNLPPERVKEIYGEGPDAPTKDEPSKPLYKMEKGRLKPTERFQFLMDKTRYFGAQARKLFREGGEKNLDQVKQFIEKSREARGELIADAEGSIRGALHSQGIMPNNKLYEDMFGEAEAAVDRALRTGAYDPSKASFHTFAGNIAKNRMKDALSRQATQNNIAEGIKESVKETVKEADDRIDDVIEAVSKVLSGLDEKAYEIVSMRHGLGGLDKMSNKEVAEALGLSTSRVSDIYNQAMGKARFAEHIDEMAQQLINMGQYPHSAQAVALRYGLPIDALGIEARKPKGLKAIANEMMIPEKEVEDLLKQADEMLKDMRSDEYDSTLAQMVNPIDIATDLAKRVQYFDYAKNVWANIKDNEVREYFAAIYELGGTLTGSVLPVRYFNSLFDPSVFGAVDEEAQQIARKRYHAIRKATEQFREALAGIMIDVNKTGLLSENRAIEALSKKGLKGKELYEESAKVMNAWHREVMRYLELGNKQDYKLNSKVFGENVSQADVESLQKSLDFLRDALGDQWDEEFASGMATPFLQDIYADYFPRFRVKPRSPAAFVRDQFGAVMGTKMVHMIRRSPATRDLMQARSVIDEMSVDPKISGIAMKPPKGLKPGERWDLGAYEKKEVLDHVVKNYAKKILHPDQFENGVPTKEGMKKIREVTKFIAELDPWYAKNQVPLYGRNFMHDFAQRMESGIMRAGLARGVQQLVARNLTKGPDEPIVSITKLFGDQNIKLDNNRAYKNVIEAVGDMDAYRAYRTEKLAELKNKINEAKGDWVEFGDYKVKVDNKNRFLISSEELGEGELATAIKEGSVKFMTEQKLEEVAKLAKKFAVKQKYGVNQNVMKEATHILKPWVNPRELHVVERAMRSMLQMFKGSVTVPFPAFWVRNGLSAFANNVFYGAYDPTAKGIGAITGGRWTKPYKQAWDLRQGKAIKGIVDELPKELREAYGLDSDEKASRWLRTQIFKYGLIGDKQGYHAEQLGETIDSLSDQMPGLNQGKYLWGIARGGAPGTSAAQKANPFHMRGMGRPVQVVDEAGNKKFQWETYDETAFALGRFGEDASRFVEDMVRTAPFLAYLKQGMSVDEAARMVHKVQVDYSDLSQFEKSIRNWIPFYTFSSRMLPLTIGDIVSNPTGKQAWTIRAAENAQGSGEGTPDHVLRGASIPWGELEDGTKRYTTGLGFAFEDPASLMGFLGGDFRGTAGDVVSRMRPEVQMLMEGATGRSLFFDRPLNEVESPLGRTAANIKQGLTGEETPGRPDPLISETVDWMATKSPFGRYISTAAKLTDTRKGILPKALNLASGVKVTDVSPRSQNYTDLNRAMDILKERGGREGTYTYVPDWLEDRMPEGEREVVREVQDLIKILQRENRRLKEIEDEKKKAEQAESLASSLNSNQSE